MTLETDPNWRFNFCTVTLEDEEQQFMEKNRKQQISGKNNQYFYIIYYINRPNIRTLAKLLLRTFLLRRLVFVNMKI